MGDILKVFSFEFKKQIRTKSYLVSLIVMAAIIIGIGFVMRYFAKDELEKQLEVKNIGIVSSLDAGELGKIYDKYILFNSEDEIKTAIEDEEIEYGLILNDLDDVKVVVNRIGTDSLTSKYTEELRDYIVNKDLAEKNLSLEKIEKMKVDVEIKEEIESLQDTNALIFVMSFISTLAIYMLILMSGTSIANSITGEKSDRTMEILLSSTSPDALIHGKVLSSLVSTLVMLVVIVVSSILAFIINIDLFLMESSPEIALEMGSMSNIDPEYIINAFSGVDFNMSPMVFISAIIFFITGYILYVYIYAALGATANRVEDLNTALTPVMVIVIAVYFATYMSMSNPDGQLMKVLSYIPFSSVFVAYIRYSLTDMGNLQLLISYAILLVTTIIFTKLSVKLYRMSSLNYGNTSFKSHIKALFSKEQRIKKATTQG